jgi:NADH-quinone oxidoreductase subunit C
MEHSHLTQVIAEALGPDLIHSEKAYGELNLEVYGGAIVRVLTILRDHPDCLFKQLIDLCGVDYPDRVPRFQVVYHLLSVHHNIRIRVKILTDAEMPIPTVTPIYNSANWYEREVWDLFGIPFGEHPDLRRILTDYNFEGHPMRKDFPLTGYVEVRYDDEMKRVVYEPVKLEQDFRNFDFLSPWEGILNRTGMANQDLPGDEKAKS